MTNSQKIIDYLWNTLGDNLKLLFIPYKRDMWDGLEGVYKEALNKGWTANVMPLPYCYRNRDFELGDWIMDDWGGIPTIEAKLPDKGEYDIILFHNQYDQCNQVTSIKPDFYTNKFIGLSRALCLVPYGIGSTASIYPGILNADFIFTENDDVVEAMLNDARRLGMNDNQINYFKQRFITTGSPKCDLDLNQTIPEDWQAKIKDKRVILFATSLVPLLRDAMGELNKYDTLLDELTSGDNIVIWRAHPLTLGTIRAMIPDCEYLYSVIRREFEAKDNTIIDDTNDYRKAFSIADVLYSVPSSLIPVWELTGKELHIV